MATCETCRFWQDIRPDMHFDGICRKQAPQVGNGSLYQFNTATWPTTLAADWCGEHQPKEAAQ